MVEYERKGFFRRRKPVVAEPEAEELEPAVEEHERRVGGLRARDLERRL